MINQITTGILKTPLDAVVLPDAFEETFRHGDSHDISRLYQAVKEEVGTTKDWTYNDELPLGVCIDDSMGQYGLGINRVTARSVISRVSTGLVELYLPLSTTLLDKDGLVSSFRDRLLIPRDTGLLIVTAGKYCIGMVGSNLSDWNNGTDWRECLEL